MFPLGVLATLALAGFAGYQWGRANNKSSNNSTTTTSTTSSSDSDSDKAKNVYNYYTNESENGNTLFGSQKKTKRTLFGE